MPFLAQPTLDLTQYRGSTQDAYVPKSSWVVMRNRVSCSVWIYLPMGQARLDCSGFSLRGYALSGLAGPEAVRALNGRTRVFPLQRSTQILPGSFPVGWPAPACGNTCSICSQLTG